MKMNLLRGTSKKNITTSKLCPLPHHRNGGSLRSLRGGSSKRSMRGGNGDDDDSGRLVTRRMTDRAEPEEWGEGEGEGDCDGLFGGGGTPNSIYYDCCASETEATDLDSSVGAGSVIGDLGDDDAEIIATGEWDLDVRGGTELESDAERTKRKSEAVVEWSEPHAVRQWSAASGIRVRDHGDLPDPSTWPNRPAFACSTFMGTTRGQNDDGVAIPIGVPFEFESDLFVGRALIRLRDVPSDADTDTDTDTDTDYYFSGRQRKFQSIIQGRFKEPLLMSDVLTGHEFVNRPLRNLPPRWILSAGSTLIGRLAPGVRMNFHDEECPHMYAPLAATSQALRADRPGEEPPVTDRIIEEECTRLGGRYFGGDHDDHQAGGVPPCKRKKLLSRPSVSSKYEFDTDTVYTFDFYQNLLDVSTYSLDLGFHKMDVSRSLNRQPIQVMAKHVDGRYLWSFQIWHEKLLPPNRK